MSKRSTLGQNQIFCFFLFCTPHGLHFCNNETQKYLKNTTKIPKKIPKNTKIPQNFVHNFQIFIVNPVPMANTCVLSPNNVGGQRAMDNVQCAMNNVQCVRVEKQAGFFPGRPHIICPCLLSLSALGGKENTRKYTCPITRKYTCTNTRKYTNTDTRKYTYTNTRNTLKQTQENTTTIHSQQQNTSD